MNIIKINPVGIDGHIQDVQIYLYNKLKKLWNFSDKEFNMFGRCYRNQTEDGYTPEVYVGNNEYKDVYWDDSLKGMAFFGIKDDGIIDAASLIADCYLIFMVNLSKLISSVQRQDEEVRLTVEELMLAWNAGFKPTGWTTGLDKTFAEYTGWKKENGIKFRDLYPYHCFRINFKILYNVYD